MDNKYGFPQAFGCLNGTHILISHPPENSQTFLLQQEIYNQSISKLYVTGKVYFYMLILFGQRPCE